jgi:hypothetical protein
MKKIVTPQHLKLMVELFFADREETEKEAERYLSYVAYHYWHFSDRLMNEILGKKSNVQNRVDCKRNPLILEELLNWLIPDAKIKLY